jgi:hypothetical protein
LSLTHIARAIVAIIIDRALGADISNANAPTVTR